MLSVKFAILRTCKREITHAGATSSLYYITISSHYVIYYRVFGTNKFIELVLTSLIIEK